MAWLQACVFFEFANSGFLLVASGFRCFNKQESAEHVASKRPRVEHRHKFQNSLFLGCLAKFRPHGLFLGPCLEKGCFHGKAVFSRNLKAPGKP